MTKAEFAPAYVWLCAALREPQDETGLTQQVYFQALGSLTPEGLQGGAHDLAQEPGRKWFPTTAEWRAAALKAQGAIHRARLESGPRRDEPWRHDCARCEDTCWVLDLACDGGSMCGRRQKHAPHTWTTRCGCWPNNRTFQRHHSESGGAS